MERIYAFTDEYGNFGWELSKPDVSTVYVITAILVKESDLLVLRDKTEEIRKRHFQTGEIKSSGIGSDHNRRQRVLAEFLPLPFKIFSVVIKKDLLLESRGLRYKQSFYKFVNNIVHKELRRAYEKITIVADQIGGSDYMKSFCAYVAARQDIADLFGDANFMFENSSEAVQIQIADLISGTLGHQYDLKKRTRQTPDYYKILEKKFIRVEQYPKTYDSYVLENSANAEDYDEDIAKLCFRQAALYIEEHKNSDEPEESARVATVQYLLFRFMNNDLRNYISSKELRKQLSNTKIGMVNREFFQLRIIAKLRDAGVIIASKKGDRGGYKIPSKQSEVFDYINSSSATILPMLARLKKCRDLIRMSTVNGLDLFAQSEYATLKRYFDESPIDVDT